jgi:hypothetical protein
MTFLRVGLANEPVIGEGDEEGRPRQSYFAAVEGSASRVERAMTRGRLRLRIDTAGA